METPKNLLQLFHHLRHRLHRLLSLISLKDLLLSLLLLICGLSPVTLHLSGGATSLYMWAPRRPPRRRPPRPALVLIHGFGGYSKWQFERQIAALSRHFDLYLPDLVFFGESESVEEKRSTMLKKNRKERAELLNELLSNGVGCGSLPILKQETLILWGEKDSIFPLPLAYALKRHLGDKAKLQVIKEAGHAVTLEQPRHVNNMIRRFILQEKVA
ncbi:uncharacterized protein LOC110029218 [Phalaenopsis equestris]|uniref:uncharacterized protein LOC110029218 n=1 Tax=Phalaenopsis equestris TaxID=78828 RepID=UPI0009E2333B|nr:uncharacterized protein LOC110029218 [Phalaenopsis equestris]